MSSWSSNNTSRTFNNGVLNRIKSDMFPARVNLVNHNAGKNGKVYTIKQQPNKVLKVSAVNSKSQDEGTMSQIAGNAGIGPKVYNARVIDGYLVLLQEKMDGTLQEYMQRYDFSSEDYRNIENLVQRLHKLDICHKDLHIKNIMYKMVNGKPDFKIIDFSRATYKKNSVCYSNRNKLNQLQRRIRRNSSPLQNESPGPVLDRLNFSSANFRTP